MRLEPFGDVMLLPFIGIGGEAVHLSGHRVRRKIGGVFDTQRIAKPVEMTDEIKLAVRRAGKVDQVHSPVHVVAWISSGSPCSALPADLGTIGDIPPQDHRGNARAVAGASETEFESTNCA